MKDENIFLIVSGALGSTSVPKVHPVSQINSIFVFCGNKSRHEQWAKDWVKVTGVYTDIESICEVLKEQTKQCDRDSTSISITNAKSANELEATFMYTTLFKEIILEIKYDQDEINKMANECRQMYPENEYESQIINEFEHKYYEKSAIWWYTRHCFLYQLLNRALRTFETSVIVAMGFFIQGLHRRIEELHSQQRNSFNRPFVVYRGQGLSETDFDKLKQSHGGLLSFNNFLSTSQDRSISQIFAREALDKAENMAILFRIDINPELTSSPFAALDEKESYFGTQEREILFSMNSIFRIGQVKQIESNARLYEIQLTLTNNNDELLQGLTDKIREEVSGSSGWHQLGKLLIQSGDFKKAEQLYDLLLERANPDDEGEISFLNHQLGLVHKESTQKHSNIMRNQSWKSLPPNHPDLATSYGNIGQVYSKMGEYSKALEYYEKSMEIQRKSLPPNHPDLATSYNNIGQVYSNMGEYSKALEYYEKSMEIRRKSLPPNHPDLATSYNNIGQVYSNMGEYSKALEYYEKSMEIQRKSLPPNHPDLATSYSNIGQVYSNMGEYSKALEYYEKSMEITRKSLPPNHPDLATSYGNIGGVYSKMGEYSKALEYYEKSMEIKRKSLPPNHPDLATSYNNIGLVYSNMGEYSKALEYYEKSHGNLCENLSLQIIPDLATSYNNIGSSLFQHGRVLQSTRILWERSRNHEKISPSKSSWLGNELQQHWWSLFQHGRVLKSTRILWEINGNPEKISPSKSSWLGNELRQHWSSLFQHGRVLQSTRILWERSIEITRKSLPPNHPDLGPTSYSNIRWSLSVQNERVLQSSLILSRRLWKSRENLSLQIILTWQRVTATLVKFIPTWESTPKHSNIMRNQWKSRENLSLQIILTWQRVTATLVKFIPTWESTPKHSNIMRNQWKSRENLSLQIILTWQRVTATLVEFIPKWESTPKHSNIMRNQWKSEKISPSKSSQLGNELQQHWWSLFGHGRVLKSTRILWEIPESMWNLSLQIIPAWQRATTTLA